MGLTGANQFSVSDFCEIFEIRNEHGQSYLLIGGQAVNYWAETYFNAEPALQELLPFTSEDIDFSGTRADVERIAKQLGRKAIFPSKVEMTAWAGAIPILLHGLKSSVEIVRAVPGVANDQLEKTSANFDFEGRQIRVIHPLLLLTNKLNLACTVSQEKRQDVRHLKIMIFVIRAFVRDLLARVESGAIDPAAWLGTANELHKLGTSAQGRKAAKHFGIDWSKCLPMPEITSAKNQKIVRFRELQLPRIRPR